MEELNNIVLLLVSPDKTNRELGAILAQQRTISEITDIWELYTRHVFENSSTYNMFAGFTTTTAAFGIYTQGNAKPMRSFQRKNRCNYSKRAWRCEMTLFRRVQTGKTDTEYRVVIKYYVDWYGKKYNLYFTDPGDASYRWDEIVYKVQRGRKELIIDRALRESLNIFLA